MSTRSIVRSLRRLAPALVIVVGASCARRPLRSQAVPPAVLRFTNESLDQATVYAVVPGLYARRIGTVMPGRTESLVVPADLTVRGNLNIVARLVARSARPQTGLVSIRPGEHYDVTLTVDQRLLAFLPSR